MRRALVAGLGLALLGGAPADDGSQATLRAELQRTTGQLKLPTSPPPYYVGYWLVDYDQRNVVATSGSLVSDDREQGRTVRVYTRVGDASFDNSNFVGDDGVYGGAAGSVPVNVAADSSTSLRRTLWRLSDVVYKQSVETLEKKRAQREIEVGSRDQRADFSSEEPVRHAEPMRRLGAKLDPVAYAKRVSGVFREARHVHSNDVEVIVSNERRHFVSSEGSEIDVPTPYLGLRISATAQADDGMPLSRQVSFQRVTGELPVVEEAVAAAKRIADELASLRAAPVVEDYSGPVLFEGLAAAQLVHDLLGEALTGTPAPKGAESLESPLARKLGKRILPVSFEAFDDPTLTEIDGLPLLGHYVVDDEGIAAQRVRLVEGGRLRGFLMSRAPRKGFDRSNGHGRNGLSGWPRGRVGNLVLRARGGSSTAGLRARLLRAVREEGGDHGLIIRELEPRPVGSGGVAVPAPVLAYRIGLDGREQLVRGAQFSPMTVRDLKDILAAGRKLAVHSFATSTPRGFDIAASVVSPSLLFEDVELRRPTRSFRRPPVVPRP